MFYISKSDKVIFFCSLLVVFMGGICRTCFSRAALGIPFFHGCCGLFLRLSRKDLVPSSESRQPSRGDLVCSRWKVRRGGTAEQAVMREVMEEVGIDLKGKFLTYCRKVFVRFPDREFTLHLFRVQLEEEPQLNVAAQEHQSYRWVTLEEALKLPLIPGGDQCLKIAFNLDKIPKIPNRAVQ